MSSYPAIVIQSIDAALKGVLPDGARMLGIAEQAIKAADNKGAQQVWPAVFHDAGNSEFAGVDDGYPGQTYHRSLSMTLTRDTNHKGYGDAMADENLVHKMCLVVFAKKDSVKYAANTLALAIQRHFPDQLTGTARPAGIKTLKINITDITLSALQVWNEEYKKTDFALGPEHIFLKVNYQIESRYDKRCFNICR